jgi:sugar (pentulose or hexulose) kinase
MRKAGPKMYDGDPLYGSSIASMIESYVEKMNMGAIPNIKTAWEHIADDEGAFAYNRAIEKYNEIYEKIFIDDEPKE